MSFHAHPAVSAATGMEKKIAAATAPLFGASRAIANSRRIAQRK